MRAFYLADELAKVATSPGPETKRQKRPAIISDSEDEAADPLQQAQAEAGPSRPQQLVAEDGTTPEEDIVCNACGSGDQGDHILLCESCDAGWHIECLEVRAYYSHGPPKIRFLRGKSPTRRVHAAAGNRATTSCCARAADAGWHIECLEVRLKPMPRA